MDRKGSGGVHGISSERSGLRMKRGINTDDKGGAGREAEGEPPGQVKGRNTKACGRGLRGGLRCPGCSMVKGRWTHTLLTSDQTVLALHLPPARSWVSKRRMDMIQEVLVRTNM